MVVVLESKRKKKSNKKKPKSKQTKNKNNKMGFIDFLCTVGLDTCLKRAVFGAAIGFIPVLLKTRPFYTQVPLNEESNDFISIPKVFSLVAPEGTDPAHTTLFPWYFLPLLLALALSLFL